MDLLLVPLEGNMLEAVRSSGLLDLGLAQAEGPIKGGDVTGEAAVYNARTSSARYVCDSGNGRAIDTVRAAMHERNSTAATYDEQNVSLSTCKMRGVKEEASRDGQRIIK